MVLPKDQEANFERQKAFDEIVKAMSKNIKKDPATIVNEAAMLASSD